MDQIEACVIGAGVVGLAVGRALARAGLETIVLERADAIGTGTSSRNSEVIHAGIYYPAGSLKARLCVAGKWQLYAYCDEQGVPYRRCGKLIVASDGSQLPELRAIEQRARVNGVDDLLWLEQAEMIALEPALRGVAALMSPSTGIIDSHALMLSLQGGLESHGGVLAVCSPVLALHSDRDGHVLQVGGDAPTELRARIVVNAAGLWAPALASKADALEAGSLPRARFAKGNYFSLAGRAPFSRLVYPVPQPGGLGVHLTLDLRGQARFGPDVQWLDAVQTPEEIDYQVDPARADAFYAEIRRYWPALPDDALQPAYSGVRPKLRLPGEESDFTHDFIIDGPESHGVPGLVNLFGIESPGLTASLAIADEAVARLLLQEGGQA